MDTPLRNDVHDDDRPIGRLLSRRDVMKVLGVSGAAALIAPARVSEPWRPATMPACVPRPELEEGPPDGGGGRERGRGRGRGGDAESDGPLLDV